MKFFLSSVFWLSLVISGFAQAKKKPVNLIRFNFKCYQEYRVDGFDSVSLWHSGKLKKTYELPGYIIFNRLKGYVKWKWSDNAVSEYSHFVFMENEAMTQYRLNNGWQIYKFDDPEFGESIAVYHHPKPVWIIYRKNKPKTGILANER